MRYGGTLNTDMFLLYMEGKETESFEEAIGKALKSGRLLFVPSLAVVELAYLLENLYSLGREEVRERIESIFTLPVDVQDREAILTALELYTDSDLSFGDCLKLAKSVLEDAQPFYTMNRAIKDLRVAEVIKGEKR